MKQSHELKQTATMKNELSSIPDDFYNCMVEELIELQTHAGSFDTQGYLTTLPSKDILKNIIKKYQFISVYDDKQENLIGIHAIIANWAIFKDIPYYRHKYKFLKSIQDSLKKGYKIIHLDFIWIKKGYRNNKIGRKLCDFSRINIKKSDKTIFVGFINPYNSYAINFAQKIGSKILLKTKSPPLFTHDYTNHIYYGNTKVSFVAHMRPYVGYSKNQTSGENASSSADNNLIKLQWDEDNTKKFFKKCNNKFILANILFPINKEKPCMKYWLFDKITGLLLKTSVYSKDKQERKVLVEDYNNFQEEGKNAIYLNVSKKIQKNEIEKINNEIKKLQDQGAVICDLGGIQSQWGKSDRIKVCNIKEKSDVSDCLVLRDSSTINEKLKNCSVIIVKHLLCRLYDYEKNLDYGLTAKTILFERLLIKAIFENKRILMIEPKIENFSKVDIACVLKVFKNFVNNLTNKGLKEGLSKNPLKWACFWWYTLADNTETLQEFDTILNLYEKLIEVKKEPL